MDWNNPRPRSMYARSRILIGRRRRGSTRTPTVRMKDGVQVPLCTVLHAGVCHLFCQVHFETGNTRRGFGGGVGLKEIGGTNFGTKYLQIFLTPPPPHTSPQTPTMHFASVCKFFEIIFFDLLGPWPGGASGGGGTRGTKTTPAFSVQRFIGIYA